MLGAVSYAIEADCTAPGPGPMRPVAQRTGAAADGHFRGLREETPLAWTVARWKVLSSTKGSGA